LPGFGNGATSSLAGFGSGAMGGSARAITIGTTAGGNTTGGSIVTGMSIRVCTIGVSNVAGTRGKGLTNVRGPCASGTNSGVGARVSALGRFGDNFTTGNDIVRFGG